jgi:hypothetical protein
MRLVEATGADTRRRPDEELPFLAALGRRRATGLRPRCAFCCLLGIVYEQSRR